MGSEASEVGSEVSKVGSDVSKVKLPLAFNLLRKSHTQLIDVNGNDTFRSLVRTVPCYPQSQADSHRSCFLKYSGSFHPNPMKKKKPKKYN